MPGQAGCYRLELLHCKIMMAKPSHAGGGWHLFRIYSRTAEWVPAFAGVTFLMDVHLHYITAPLVI